MKNVLFVLGIVTLLFMFGCSVEPSEISKSIANKTSKRITYFKDHRTGLCFAIVASRKTGSTDQTGLGMSLVPCVDVEKLLVN